MSEWRAFPKLELHLHLEGAAPPAFIRGLASEKRVDLSGLFDEAGHYAFRDFRDFLRVYEAATSVLRNPRDYARLTRAVLETSAAEGVVYTEAFLSPDFCGGGDVVAWRDYLAAMQEEAAAVAAQGGPEMVAIVTAVRHLGPDKSRKVARCAAETAGDFLRGFGIAGDERAGAATDFAWAFDCAREAGLGLTAHAGEWAGPESVRAALDVFRPSRLGHGVRAIEDLALVDRLAEQGIVLEVSPGSNVALGLYPSWAAHPIAQLAERGVKVTVSTDDPPFFHTTMTREFDALAKAFGWGAEEFATLNRTALEASFAPPALRQRIAKIIGETQ
ncbi:MAG: adenosine deaminase [Rhodobacteraceae bacterium]|nr:adenosine deaminase [Paracoccaceae bacterium]